jgi:Flp pilus assembly protein TadG
VIGRLSRHLRALRRDQSGLALLEFAFITPIFLVLSLSGAEVTNYVITRMRISQIALHLADNAARIGNGSLLQAKTITEADINDLLTGTGMQSGELNLYGKGRVTISSVEPVANPNTTNRYRIRWQRCRGLKSDAAYRSRYTTADTNITGAGPAGKAEVTAQDGGATMYVEVSYEYTPLVGNAFSRAGGAFSPRITEVASMMVRDRRDLVGGNNGVYPVTGVTASTCNLYTAT